MRGGGRGGIWLEDGNATITGNTIVNNNTVGPTTYTVTNCTNNGAGLIRVTTSAATFFETNDMVEISGVTGTTEANGRWIVTVINSTTFDLSVNADSDTGAASAFVNAYVSGGTAQEATSSIRILPSAPWVVVSGNSLGGASGGVRQTEYGIHNAALDVLCTNNSVQSVRIAPYRSIVNNRRAYGRNIVGVASVVGAFDPYAVDGGFTFVQGGAVTAGTKNFSDIFFVSGYKLRIIRATTNLSSAAGNSVTARFLVNGSLVGSNLVQNGNTITDTLISTPIVIDGTTTPQFVQLSITATSGSPTDYVFQAQYQMIG